MLIAVCTRGFRRFNKAKVWRLINSENSTALGENKESQNNRWTSESGKLQSNKKMMKINTDNYHKKQNKPKK